MEEDSCAFCGAAGEEAAVRTEERLGVQVAVCAACRERFAGAPAGPPAPRAPLEQAADLPPTLGQQSSGVYAMVQRMARLAADRPFVEEDCGHCGHLVHRYPGADGGQVRLAKESVLAASVPAGQRWRVLDGRAVPEGPADEDEDQVGARVLHDVVCPANPVPDNPRLARMWHSHLAPPPAD